MRTSEQIFEELRALTDRSDHLQRREREITAELQSVEVAHGVTESKRRELLNALDVQLAREAEARRTGEPAAIPVVLKPTGRHIAYVDPIVESTSRGGTSRVGACSCGWRGPERSTLELAADDALQHEGSGMHVVQR
ncbi:MAG TPA: hypothetical protein VLT45_02470 [Kofleriaceae bacterium]|nr:hypothetical protein [Kofleriaceae bacterium]